jgi:hypothetical protein
VYVACLFLGLFVVVVGCSIAAQIVRADTVVNSQVQTGGIKRR